MDTAVLREIESLRRASMVDLREKFREVFQEETRCKHREHLFRRIAWRLQALAEGDLSERARERAHQIAQDGDLRINAPRDFFSVGGERVHFLAKGTRSEDSRWIQCQTLNHSSARPQLHTTMTTVALEGAVAASGSPPRCHTLLSP